MISALNKSGARYKVFRLAQLAASLITVLALFIGNLSGQVPVASADERVHVVQEGETLSQIANKYDVDVILLAEANGIGSLDLVYIGQELKIPAVGSPRRVKYVVQPGENLFQIALRYNLSPATLAAVNGITDPDLVVAGQELAIPLDAQHAGQGSSGTIEPLSYTVQPGESLSQIADRYHLTPTVLAAANGLSDPDLVVPGQVLTIPAGAQPVPQAAPPESRQPPPATTHAVQPGENLFRIALQYKLSPEALAAANGITDLDLLAVGQVLKIPAGAQLPPSPAPAPATPVAYTVQPGDTLVAIADSYGVEPSAILQASGIADADLIGIGQTLKVPNPTRQPTARGVRPAAAPSPISAPQPASPAQPTPTPQPPPPRPQPTAPPTESVERTAPPPPPPPPPAASATSGKSVDGQVFRVTQYCLQGRTASGKPVQAGVAAADPSVLRLGQKIEIDGLGRFTVEDRFAYDAGQLRVDIWVPDCRQALRWGIQYRRVKLVN